MPINAPWTVVLFQELILARNTDQRLYTILRVHKLQHI